MKANSFEIMEISIHVNRNEVCLTGSALHGVMHYPTVLYIDYSQLNRVLGLLQNMNPQSEITENFERNVDSDGNELEEKLAEVSEAIARLVR